MEDDLDMMINVKQIKLANGDEIICSVHPEDLAEKPFISVWNALTLFYFEVGGEFTPEMTTRYAFKPLMSLQEDTQASIIIRADQIVCWYTPSVSVIDKYYEIIESGKISKK